MFLPHPPHCLLSSTVMVLCVQVEVEKYVKVLPRRPETSDMTPQLIEEYILETAERGQARVYHTRYRIII